MKGKLLCILKIVKFNEVVWFLWEIIKIIVQYPHDPKPRPRYKSQTLPGASKEIKTQGKSDVNVNEIQYGTEIWNEENISIQG